MPTFNCPTCQKPVEWSSAAKWRPFCSERCRLIDLGAWLTEQHAIPGSGDSDPDNTGDTGPAESQSDDPRRH